MKLIARKPVAIPRAVVIRLEAALDRLLDLLTEVDRAGRERAMWDMENEGERFE